MAIEGPLVKATAGTEEVKMLPPAPGTRAGRGDGRVRPAGPEPGGGPRRNFRLCGGRAESYGNIQPLPSAFTAVAIQMSPSAGDEGGPPANVDVVVLTPAPTATPLICKP